MTDWSDILTRRQSERLGKEISRLKTATLKAVRATKKHVKPEPVHAFVERRLLEVYPAPTVSGYDDAIGWITTVGRAAGLADEYLKGA